METLTEPVRQEAMILCCMCGVSIEPNPTNMCVACLRTQVDVTENIPKQATIQFCRSCERYLQPPAEWIHAALESRELLTLCLKKLKSLNRVKLIDAGFVWTEPHSMRLKVKLTVQAEVMGGAVLQQVFIVEYIVNHQMCDDCHRIEAKDYWRALVQVRQKATNKKTFYYLEQLILKYKAHEQTLGIKPVHEGLDFFFANEATARKLVDFLSSVIPCRYDHSKKLLSHDIHSNIYNYKFTYSVEIVPISRDSVVCLPRKLSHQLGGINPICLVYKITNSVHLIDVASGQIAEFNATVYWRHAFNSICDPKQLVEYTVMDIEPIKSKDRRFFPGQGTISEKHVIADVWLVRSCDLGINDNLIHTRTHLGHVLKPGDTALGYALSESNINDDNFETLNKDLVPDVILTKKSYAHDVVARRRMRAWKLKHMLEDKESMVTENNDYYEFLEDLEENPEMRQNINIFRDSRKVIPVDTNELSDPSCPQITLEEMLDDLVIDDVQVPQVL
ncbi:60S ribosomal export protein NMD3 isoform X2 [Ceratina calcarata]|uniref:60S ribosomal export protein NMD3 n=1 Tax=Ceratina calcarata TaxID=156304 RepID=A0AAJ7J6J2_9HYME|nr:60S ribosomal export protein NMD3 isoform X1 [Ceratina calcarata]XP_017885922.1 60S ribosomal export protein NMD3 isoform X2 [Ceratina calcarata]